MDWYWYVLAVVVSLVISASKLFAHGYDREDKRKSFPLQPAEREFLEKHVRNGHEETGFLIRPRGTGTHLRLFYRFWLPKRVDTPIKAVAVTLHGLCDHSGRRNDSYAALLDAGFVVAGLDYEGHGRSEGRHGYFHDFEDLVKDAIAFVEMTREVYSGLKLFVVGGSLGGLLALHMLAKTDDKLIDGAVIQCPAVEVDPSTRPPYVVELLGRRLRAIVPKLPVAQGLDGKCSSPEVQELNTKLFQEDQLCYHGRLRIGTGLALLEAMTSIHTQLHHVVTPFLLQHGTADRVCTIQGSREVFEKTKSKDKTFKEYEGGAHDLREEPLRIREPVTKDLVQWIEARV